MAQRECSNEYEGFVIRSEEIISRFEEQRYKNVTFQTACAKAKHLDRQTLQQKKEWPKQTNDRASFVITYSTEAVKIRQIINSYWGIIQSDTTLSQIFSEPPLIRIRGRPTLQDKWVHSHFQPNNQHTWLGSKTEGSYKCNHCTNRVQTKTFTDFISQKEYTINYFINCKI